MTYVSNLVMSSMDMKIIRTNILTKRSDLDFVHASRPRGCLDDNALQDRGNSPLLSLSE